MGEFILPCRHGLLYTGGVESKKCGDMVCGSVRLLSNTLKLLVDVGAELNFTVGRIGGQLQNPRLRDDLQATETRCAYQYYESFLTARGHLAGNSSNQYGDRRFYKDQIYVQFLLPLHAKGYCMCCVHF